MQIFQIPIFILNAFVRLPLLGILNSISHRWMLFLLKPSCFPSCYYGTPEIYAPWDIQGTKFKEPFYDLWKIFCFSSEIMSDVQETKFE